MITSGISLRASSDFRTKLTVVLASKLSKEISLIETFEENWLDTHLLKYGNLLFPPDQDRNWVLCKYIRYGLQDLSEDSTSTRKS